MIKKVVTVSDKSLQNEWRVSQILLQTDRWQHYFNPILKIVPIECGTMTPLLGQIRTIVDSKEIVLYYRNDVKRWENNETPEEEISIQLDLIKTKMNNNGICFGLLDNTTMVTHPTQSIPVLGDLSKCLPIFYILKLPVAEGKKKVLESWGNPDFYNNYAVKQNHKDWIDMAKQTGNDSEWFELGSDWKNWNTTKIQ